MVAHNTVYTYISSCLGAAGARLSVDVALVTFGVAALAGIAITAALVDRALRRLVLVSIGLFITDVANSMLGVAFNLAIFTSGVLGAVLITTWDGLALPTVMMGLALVALLIAAAARRTAFPVGR